MSEENNRETNEAWKIILESQQNIFDTWKKGFELLNPVSSQESFSGAFDNMMKEWEDNQRKLMEFWKDALNNNNLIPFPLPAQEMPQEVPKRMNEFFENWYKNFTQNISEMSKWMPFQLGQENYNKMFQDSTSLYNQLYDFWNKFLSEPQNNTPHRINEITRDWMENYNKILKQYLSQSFGEPFSTFFRGTAELGETFNKTTENFTKPWMDSSNDLQKAANKLMQGDREAYMEFIRIWQEAFQDSYGKLFNVPSFGFSRETNEKVLRSVDAYMDYINSSTEFTFSLYKVGYDAMDKLMRKIQAENKKGNPPESFKDFYDLWLETNEEAYLELFRQESFARMLGNLLDAGVSFKHRFDDLVTDGLEQLPIPTDNDMDSVYKKIYELNKEVKEQSDKIENIKEKLNKNKKEINTEFSSFENPFNPYT